MNATLWKVGVGHRNKVTPKNGTDFTLEELYELLKCELIEVIHLDANDIDGEAIMIVDEEGRLKDNKEFNALASAEFYFRKMHRQEIYGDAIVCDPSMLK